MADIKKYIDFFSCGLNTFGTIIFCWKPTNFGSKKLPMLVLHMPDQYSPIHVSQTITLDLCWKQNGVNSNSSYPIPHAMGWSLMMCLVQAKRSPNSHCSCQDYKQLWLMGIEDHFTDNSGALSPNFIKVHLVLINILMIRLNYNFEPNATDQLSWYV